MRISRSNRATMAVESVTKSASERSWASCWDRTGRVGAALRGEPVQDLYQFAAADIRAGTSRSDKIYSP